MLVAAGCAARFGASERAILSEIDTDEAIAAARNRRNEILRITAADIIDRLHRDLLAFAAGTPQEDDLTAVVIKRRA